MKSVSSPWKIRRIALVSTGSEILQGQYADSNARYLAEELTLMGLTVVSIMAAPDDESAIEAALRYSANLADIIISTGGLGPTRDDRNRFVFQRVFETELKRDEKAIEMMGRRFVTRGLGPLPEANEVQALLPVGCTPLYNRWGTAPGFLLPPTGAGVGAACGLMALPGPPSEMIPMFNEVARPLLGPYLETQRRGVIRTIHTYGYPESQVGTLVQDLFDPYDNVEFNILAKVHGVDLRIRSFGETLGEAEELARDFAGRVRERIPSKMIYGEDNDTLASAVGGLLKSRGQWVATAESCTGGMIASMLTEVAGSSAYLGQCHVTYSNDAKTKILGVKEQTLEQFGAVSEETAREMAEGLRRVSKADWAISVTGIAGPDGGSETKPVGLTYIGISGADGTQAFKQQFNGTRAENRLRASQVALNQLRLRLLDHF